MEGIEQQMITSEIKWRDYVKRLHGVGHGEPIGAKVDFLDVSPLINLLEVEADDEINVLREPTDGEDGHHNDHHFDHLWRP